MKKIMLAGLVLAVVGIFGAVRSASCASAPGTQPSKFTLGLEQSYIFDRDLALDDLWEAPEVAIIGTKIKVKDLGMTMLQAGYQVSKNLNVYVKAGVADADGGFEMRSKGPWTGGTFTENEEYRGNLDAFAWGAGFKLCFPLGNNWIVGADAKYLEHKNDYKGRRTVRFFDTAGNLLPGLSVDDYRDSWGSVTISEWHVAPFVAKDFGKFVPYIGVRYSDMRVAMKEDSDALHATDNWGAFVGADFKLNKTFFLNLEGRFLDETAMTLAAGLTF